MPFPVNRKSYRLSF